MTASEALHALLFKRSVRRAFAERGPSALRVDAELALDLAAVDREHLDSAARLACRGLLERSHRGSGSLVSAFPRTIGAWLRARPGATLDDLAAELAESPELDAYHALPTCAESPSLEEAFLRFAERGGAGEPAVREAECACAILRTLVVTKAPSFVLPPFVRRAPGGYFAVLEDGPTLVAALGDRLLIGRITPLLAELLVSRDAPSRVAERLAVDASVARAAHDELAQMGLVPASAA